MSFKARWAFMLALLDGLLLGSSPAQAQHMQHSQSATKPPSGDAVQASTPVLGASKQPESKPAAMRKPRPQLGSAVAFDPQGRLWLVGLNLHGRLFFQHTLDKDLQQWSEPRLLDVGTDAISADGENRPKLAWGALGQVVITYTQPLSKPFTGMIRMLRSTDAGQSFSKPYTVHQDRQIITHRFESVAFDARGDLYTVWIDKRDLELAPKVDNKSTYSGAAIYANVSKDGGLTFGADTKVADHTCECCRIALAAGDDGYLRAMWRHVFDGNIRDHAFAKLGADGSGSIARASNDGWHLTGCPHHGPGLAPASGQAKGQGFHAVWFGSRKVQGKDKLAVRYGRLAESGVPDEATVRELPDPQAEHADVAAQGERVVVAWRSFNGEQWLLRAWVSNDGGRQFVLRDLAQTHAENDHPRLVHNNGRVVVVWRDANKVNVYEVDN
jgi:hypothetical protein